MERFGGASSLDRNIDMAVVKGKDCIFKFWILQR
jgi:hypothetical protein